MSYNGYANFQTWDVSLWLDNDPGLYESVRRIASQAFQTYGNTPQGLRFAAGSIEEMVKEMTPDLGASLFADLLGAALGEVDWLGIAEHALQSAEEG